MNHALKLLVIALLAPAAALAADLKLPAIFSDHMVLQRSQPLPVWGWGQPGQQVSVSIAGQTKTAAIDPAGKWTLTLDKIDSADAMTLTVSSAGKSITVTDVLAGEVWLCGGQSNMERQLGPRPPQPLIQNWQQEAATATYPQIRHFFVAHDSSKEPAADVKGNWVVCSPQTVKDFTAVGYFFGRELHNELKCPVGLLHSSWGGTGVATWTSRAAIEQLPDMKPKLAAQFAEPKFTNHTPSALFQNMIAPLIPFRIKGVIWFQGESGPGLPVPYETIFQLMITDWRSQWKQGDFPFYFIQLPNGSPWTREAQAKALALPNTGMAVGIDVGDKDVHGPIKVPLGKRLALLALAGAYGRGGETSGPVFQSAAVEGNAMRITFTHADEGLSTKDGAPLQQFTIAGADKKFVPAEAKIDGQTLLVSSRAVPKPIAVRYAWTNVAAGGNLYNKQLLPAAPFRTDKDK